MKSSRIAAILLAAGFSSRMGKVKALLPWQGKTLIEYQIEQMIEAGITEVIVVLGFKAEELRKKVSTYDVTTVVNENFTLGKSTSIRKGAACISGEIDGILVSAVDQPVSSETLRTIVNSFSQTKSKVTIPIYQEKRGHPVLFSASVKQDLLKVNEATKGLRNVILKYKQNIEYVPVFDSHVLLNLNSPDDYRMSNSNK